MREKIAGLKQEKKTVEVELEGLEAAKTPVLLHPTAMASYLRCVDSLEQSIRTSSLEGSEASKDALRQLVDSVIAYPPQSGGGDMRVEVRGYLARLVGGDLFPQRSFQGGTMVAEERIRRNHPFLKFEV